MVSGDVFVGKVCRNLQRVDVQLMLMQNTFISLAQQMFPQASFLEIRYMFGRPWQNTGDSIRKKRLFSYQLGGRLCLFVSY